MVVLLVAPARGVHQAHAATNLENAMTWYDKAVDAANWIDPAHGIKLSEVGAVANHISLMRRI